ncbi:uncharacterized protein LOC124162807 [Ischnura elegans]|uniref:uncharacterized protein LOC124162807 n=1 Tax=Ischnura elegans TaxID=197161 RepID=UPI001ED86B35|nr:uncharacterized protein LOC124162807 [Ischnura elegans]
MPEVKFDSSAQTKDGDTRGQPPPGRKVLPPDGGWGWCIVFAYALNNVTTLPMLQSYGLLFKDKFEELNMTAADRTAIINVNLALAFGLGLLNGPLLRRYSYRKLAMAGSLILFSGTFLTSFASNFTQFLIFYGILSAIGYCFLSASFSLAMNSYFCKLRGRATGLALASTGLGPILMPFLISYLLQEYTSQGAIMIMSGLALHSLAATLLLQPVKWHTKPVLVDDIAKASNGDNEGEDDEQDSMLYYSSHPRSLSISGVSRRKMSLALSGVEHDLDAHSIYGCQDPLVTPSIAERSYGRGSVVSVYDPRRQYLRSVSQDVQSRRNYWWNSVETVNLGSSYRIFDERSLYIQLDGTEEETEDKDEAGVSKSGRIMKRATKILATFFDFDLLSDPVYVSILLGLSAAIFGELNFSMITPFILNDFGFTTDQVARVMSTSASVDIVFRFMVPFIAERFKVHPRLMYMGSLMLLVASRSMFLFFDTYYSVLCIAVFLGLSKGIRTVYTPIIIPTYVPLEKLPGASGIQMLMNGLVFSACGPILGVFRDLTGQYTTCLYLINGMTLLTVLAWTIEYFVSKKGFRLRQ